MEPEHPTTAPRPLVVRFAWIGALVALCVLGASFVFSPDTLPNLPVCGLKRTTGLPCPGCGMTHAFCAISHGEWSRAWSFHPLSFVLYAGFVALVAWPAIGWLAPRIADRLARSRAVQIALVALAALFAVHGAARLWLEYRSRG